MLGQVWCNGWHACQVNPNAMKLVFAASLLITQHSGVRAKTGWLRIRIMCSSGTISLPLLQ
jgi:hypothetical protein